LAIAVAKTLRVDVKELDRCLKCYGLRIDLDFGL